MQGRQLLANTDAKAAKITTGSTLDGWCDQASVRRNTLAGQPQAAESDESAELHSETSSPPATIAAANSRVSINASAPNAMAAK
jgi:hypothetical protein